MIETNIPEINVEEIMDRIREEVKQRRQKNASPDFNTYPIPGVKDEPLQGFNDDSKITLPTCPVFSQKYFEPDVSALPIKEIYTLDELLVYHDVDFINNAYAAILHRSPDHDGKQYYLSHLRSARLTKAEILGLLRYSGEARNVKTRVKIKGLAFPFILQRTFKIPFLGFFIRVLTGIFKLPTILRNIQVLESQLFMKHSALNDITKGMHSQIHVLRDHIALIQDQILLNLKNKVNNKRFNELQEDCSKTIIKINATEKQLSETLTITESGLKDEIAQVTERVTITESGLKDEIQNISKKILNYRRNLIDQERRLTMFLTEARKRLPEPFSREQLENLVSEEDHINDAMYVAFEDQFRGTREDIKERQRLYIPYIEKVMQQTGGGEILDVGCGRGEWLELLKEEGYDAKGVDINRAMVTQSQESGLNVIAADALAHLRDLPANSLAAVTGFHIVEHLPFNVLMALFDESLRVLKSDGIVIFETPNPENLIVGACTFYIDPSHRNPLHPLMLKFLLESRKIQDVQIIRCNPNDSIHLDDKILQSLLFGAQDYSVTGRK